MNGIAFEMEYTYAYKRINRIRMEFFCIYLSITSITLLTQYQQPHKNEHNKHDIFQRIMSTHKKIQILNPNSEKRTISLC